MLTFTGTLGVTDRLDVSAAVPVISLSMSGSRVNTYRGTQQVQATADASTSGLGDVAVRAKYALLAAPQGGVAVAGELRLPTGRSNTDVLIPWLHYARLENRYLKARTDFYAGELRGPENLAEIQAGLN